MSEAPSTSDLTVRWAAESRVWEQAVGTGSFAFPHEIGHAHATGHLVVSEPVAEEEVVPDVSETVLDAAERTQATFGPTPVRGPRAKRLTAPPSERYILLKKYEGFVISRQEDSFLARLFENQSDHTALEAEFELEELSETDRKLAVEGAPMVWTIGYRYDGSTRKRESAIYLRRLPAWTEKEIRESARATEELVRAIRWE